ncbi:ABC transporter ATP-binding protein [Actinomyces bowdenii]|uniref:ABC transporter ATP-binding protein n=1 Tax=Actinomyces bowdenii TaxID=131109 RepID=UPI001ABCDA5B|nr:ABC transporter ATP-binding protein [Actinomyces bowdenii]MBO3723819.1 ABC transporter ATP-binding protein [Actinomyces bowdenii]
MRALMEGVVNMREMRRITAWFVASALLQGTALALMIPFLRALYRHSPSVGLWLAAVMALGAAAFITSTIAMNLSYRVSVFEICDTMVDHVANHVLRLPLGWFNAQRQAEVVNATSKEVNTLSHLASMVVPNLCNAFIVPLVMLVATAVVEWPLALIMALSVGPLVLVWRRMSQTITRANELEDAASAQAAGRLVEYARLQPVLRASGRTEEGWGPALQALEADSRATLEGLRLKGRPAQGFTLTVNLAFALVMAVGLSLVSGHELDAVAYLAIMAVTARMLMPLTTAALYAVEYDNARVALRSVREILDAQPLPDPEPQEVERPRGTAIALDGVSFAYEEGQQVLDGVSLSAPQGRVTALVGPSGAGKSTILRLAARFWDADQGSVSMGGVDVCRLPAAQIMAMTSMVFQEVYLFDTTIAENLRIARPGATDAELEEAARRARLDRVIEALPNGWQTRVGPGGLSLSGGERQRVAIARAFIKDAPILLLDEITSALDGENEAAITEVVRELSRGRTVIVVAHRLSTIRQADQIVFLQPTPRGARVAQRGGPEALAQVEGPFRDFIEASTASSRWRLTRP